MTWQRDVKAPAVKTNCPGTAVGEYFIPVPVLPTFLSLEHVAKAAMDVSIIR